MQSFREKEFPRLGRRDFLKAGAAAGLSFVIPSFISCGTKATSGVGDTMPNIVLGSIANEEVVIPAAFSGKAVILHFWASWCPTCRAEMTALETVFREYSNRGALPCSIGIGEKRATALRYIKNLSISYPVLLDPDSLTQRLLGISGVPTYYLLDRRGIIRRKILGEAGSSGWDSIIRTVL
jgi:cytochrome c biogenesis protein CcmG, thiol:disulfide interchange protein DsbE